MPSQPSRKIRRTMFIGLGGTGNLVVRRVKQEMLSHKYNLPLFQYLVLDTVAFDEKPNLPSLRHLRNGEEYLYIGNYNPNEVLKNISNWPVIARWWGSRSRINLVTVDEGAGQMRSVGRMGFFYHFNSIETQLRRMVQEITSVSNRERAMLDGYDVSTNDPIIYVVFSLCGGTGSSLFFDVAYVIRHLLSSAGMKPTIVGVAMLPGPYLKAIGSIPQQERIQANGYAALTELERLHNMALGLAPRPNGKDIWSVQYTTNFRVDSAELPFEYTYLVDEKTFKGEDLERERIYDALGKGIFWLSGPSTATEFWERAKNLNSKTVASGGLPDATGRKRLTPYSSLGISTVKLDWRLEGVRYELENTFIERIRMMSVVNAILPLYLNSENALVEELSGDATRVNPFPSSKALQAPTTVQDTVAIQEMLERHTEKYQASLNNFIRSSLWLRKREECVKAVTSVVDKHMQISLSTRGPVATTKELETIKQNLVARVTGLDDLNQKAKTFLAELEATYATSPVVAEPKGILRQTIENLVGFIKDLYIVKRFRHTATPRELTAIAQQKARERYQWYQVKFNIIAYTDIIKTVLEPLIEHVETRKAMCEGADHELEAIYEENRDVFLSKPKRGPDKTVTSIRPLLTEKDQVQEAITTGRLKVDMKLADIFKQAFSTWPRAGSDVMTDLKLALDKVVIDSLKIIGGEEHLTKRLCGNDATVQRDALLAGAECMWNFTQNVSQDILSHLEPIEILGYGVDGDQDAEDPAIKSALDELLKNQPTRPTQIATDISDEIVLLKTSHGLPISAIRPMDNLQQAYQVMNSVRGAPYLHIDYADQVRAGYGPLTIIARTYQELLQLWEEEAKDIDQSDPNLAGDVKAAGTVYQNILQRNMVFLEGIVEVRDEIDPFFDFVAALRRAIWKTKNQTAAVSQARMRFAELESILFSQGWIKIEPGHGQRFDPQYHNVVNKTQRNDMLPDRVIEVHQPGYTRQQSNNAGAFTVRTRLALVDISKA